MDKSERELSRQDAQVACPVCSGAGKRPFHNLAIRCKLCRGSGLVPYSYILIRLEEKVMDYIYEEAPVGAICPRCETEIDPDECIKDTISSRKEWAEMVREVIRIVKEEQMPKIPEIDCECGRHIVPEPGAVQVNCRCGREYRLYIGKGAGVISRVSKEKLLSEINKESEDYHSDYR